MELVIVGLVGASSIVSVSWSYQMEFQLVLVLVMAGVSDGLANDIISWSYILFDSWS